MSRDTLKSIIDVVDENELDTIYRVLVRFVADDVLTPDEAEAVDISKNEFARGEIYTHEEVWS